uniref:Putative ovule protein n=1 Tax=Solanum chacoense TaxID=4108 RepID=A0A0V0GPJ8_SOLCH
MKLLCTRLRKYNIERHSGQILIVNLISKVYTYHIVIFLRPNMIILVMLFSHYLIYIFGVPYVTSMTIKACSV